MRATLLPFLFATLATPLFAGSGGPDAYGYTWQDNFEPNGPVFNWIDITANGVQVLGLADDNVVGPFVMETNFEYYWYNRKFIWVGSNGYVAFNNGNIASPFPAIPVAGGTNDYITGIMADLNFSGAGNPGQCWFLDDPDYTIISYINVPFWTAAAPSYTGSNTFQIILDKSDSTITVQILQQSGLTQNNDITIGIESVAGSIGLQHSKNVYPGGNYAIRYTRPTAPLLAVTDVAASWNTEPGSGARFLSRNGAPFPLTARVVNIGATLVDPFQVTGTVLNAANQVQTNEVVNVGGLVPTGEHIVDLATPFAPTVAGTYRFRTTVSGVANDLVAANNQLTQELVVVDTTAATQDLRYHGATDDGLGLSWNGGNGGIGIHIVPPYYPAYATHTTLRIVSNPNASAFTMRVYADDGPNGAPGTLLDSVFVPGAQATPGDKVIPMNNPAIITGGGVYVLWYMQGDLVAIARDATAPFSFRTYEVLSGVWAEYRDREATDFFLGLRLSQQPVLDVACESFFEPAAGSTITAATTVRAFIRNVGNQPLSTVPMRYQYGQNPVVQQTWTGTLLPGQQTLFSFSQQLNPTVDGLDELCAWADLAGDASTANDTTCISITTVTGLEEQYATPLHVMPNPATDRLRVEGLPAGLWVVELLDATGRRVMQLQHNAAEGPLWLTVEHLPAGAYTLRTAQGDLARHAHLVLVR
ncbi:MAG: hypothetical protein KF905_15285 [Flavobacteriales bacterium]|nr:hypothetical protein [Flavobacteriales bacterium]